jgi:Ca2+-binding RTX toxin-like protein
MRTRLTLLVALAFAAFAAPAGAATVSQTVGPAFQDTGDLDGCARYMQCGTKRTVNVVAGSGERNTISAELVAQNAPFGNLIVRDTHGGPLDVAPGSNCTVTAPSEVTCGAPITTFVGDGGAIVADALIMLGDGDDSATARTLPLAVYGGPGADLLTATNAPVVFYGEDGNDTLHGGPGSDFFFGGNDRDHLFGGAGDDFLDGGAGDDDIFGQLGDDQERGGNGRDLVDGGSGKDRISGGKGRDALLGRAGVDRLSSRDGQRDRVSCGSGKGRDRGFVDRKDKTSGCERLAIK